VIIWWTPNSHEKGNALGQGDAVISDAKHL
jgi:hypothetical protein